MDHPSLLLRMVYIYPLFTAWAITLLAALLAGWHWYKLSTKRLPVALTGFATVWLALLIQHAACPHGHFIAIGPLTFGTGGQRNCNQSKQYVPIWWPLDRS